MAKHINPKLSVPNCPQVVVIDSSSSLDNEEDVEIFNIEEHK